MRDQSGFTKLLQACAEIAEMFADGVVFIGGIAVYLHAANQESTAQFAGVTYDADMYISLADMADLRDAEEVIPNRRLSRHQMIRRGLDFDIYTERLSSLIVPYDAILAESTTFDGIRVAAIEHLLVLKLEAFSDRKGSAKGDKDARDVLRICAVAHASPTGFRPHLVLPYLRDDHLLLLAQVTKGPHATTLASGNAQAAKRIRECAQEVAEALESG